MTARADQSYVRPISVPITDGATTPNPGVVDAVAISSISGEFLRWTGTEWTTTCAAVPASAPPTDIQIFETNGTWTRPTAGSGQTYTSVEIFVQASGAGGGSGRRGANGTIRCGGGGGASGQYVRATFPFSLFSATHAVTLPAGGAGAPAVTADDTNGTDAANTASASFNPFLRVGSGQGGKGGTATTGLGGPASGSGGQFNSLAGAPASTSGGVGGTGSTTFLTPGGGGAGGGLTAANAPAAGGAGSVQNAPNPARAGGVAGAVGAAGSTPVTASATGEMVGGAGGGGGGASDVAPAGAGGAGAKYGAGGGGGGASANGNDSGAGGNGAAGLVVAITR